MLIFRRDTTYNSKHTYERDYFQFVAYSVVAFPIVGLGIVGNLLSLVVLSRPNLKGIKVVLFFSFRKENFLFDLRFLSFLNSILFKQSNRRGLKGTK